MFEDIGRLQGALGALERQLEREGARTQRAFETLWGELLSARRAGEGTPVLLEAQSALARARDLMNTGLSLVSKRVDALDRTIGDVARRHADELQGLRQESDRHEAAHELIWKALTSSTQEHEQELQALRATCGVAREVWQTKEAEALLLRLEACTRSLGELCELCAQHATDGRASTHFEQLLAKVNGQFSWEVSGAQGVAPRAQPRAKPERPFNECEREGVRAPWRRAQSDLEVLHELIMEERRDREAETERVLELLTQERAERKLQAEQQRNMTRLATRILEESFKEKLACLVGTEAEDGALDKAQRWKALEPMLRETLMNSWVKPASSRASPRSRTASPSSPLRLTGNPGTTAARPEAQEPRRGASSRSVYRNVSFS